MMRSPIRSAFGSALILVSVFAWVASSGCQEAGRATRTHPGTGLPRLVELGIPICIPCAMMAPVLDELKKEYAGRLEVESIDTLKNLSAKTQYDAPFCATQIFIDPSGKELFRHVGFYAKADILDKWKELGVDLEASAAPREAPKSAAQTKAGRG
ncbi:MAG: thioredoxin domain-containing protein [Planctomycetota bacterium]|nr:thioredoxin domain-containing protein [Planctomycetota bacterium]